MNDQIQNPSVANALASIGGPVSDEMSNILGGAPPIAPPLPPAMPRGRPGGGFQVAADATNAANRQLVNEAASGKGYTALASKKFSALSALVPGAERVRVRRRKADGTLASLRDYNKTDVEHSGDIESFINMYIRPTYGGGEYNVALVDAQGKEFDGGIVRFDDPPKDPYAHVAPPPPPDPNNGMMPLLIEMYRTSTKPIPTPDPIQQLRAAKELLMDTTPKTNNDNAFSAMLQMQASAAAENQKLLITLMGSRQGPDPAVVAMTALLERMDRRLEKLEATPPPPPPPPMMMPAAPAFSMPEMITAITGAMAVVVPLMKGDPGPKSTEIAQLILQAQTAARPTDGLGVRDVIDIFQKREQDASPPATLEEQMGTLARLKEFVSVINPPPPSSGQTGTTFWDAAIAIMGNGSEISKAIGASVDRNLNREPQLPQQQPQRVQITENRSVQPAQNPQITQAAPPPEDRLPLPENFGEKMASLESASSPGERITATVDALMSLRGLDQWNGFTQKLLISVAEGDRESSMKLLGGWLKILMDGNLLKRETAMATLAAFHENFVVVRAGVIEKVPMLRPVAQAADMRQAADAEARQAQDPAAGAAAEAAPPQEDEAEEESGEKQTGPAPVGIDVIDRETLEYTQGSL